MEHKVEMADSELSKLLNSLTEEETADLFEDISTRRSDDERRFYKTRREEIRESEQLEEKKGNPNQREFYSGLIPTAQVMFDYTKYNRAQLTNYKALRAIRLRNLYYYNSSCRNGYYRGFLSTVICQKCDAVLDCFPSKFKRIFLIPMSACPLCRGKVQRMNRLEVGLVDKESKNHPSDAWEFYYVAYKGTADPDTPEKEEI